MVNRYAGTCHLCDARVAPRAGLLKRSPAGGYWQVAHLTCINEGVPRVVQFRLGGRSYIRNSQGLCEDAPCCGCCTI